MKIVTVEEMRRLEDRSIEAGVSADALMEAAGLAVARRIGQLMEGTRGKRVLVLVGPGNNGGDGLVAARYLSDWGVLVTLYMTTASRGKDDKFEECRSRRIRVVEGREDQEQWALSSYLSLTDLVVDAVLGIGQRLPLDNNLSAICTALNEARERQPVLQVVAVDVPTGLDADSGAVDPFCLSADVTIALGAPKAGLFKFPAAEHVGGLETVEIGIPVGLDADLGLELASNALAASFLPPRALGSHKGTYGHLVVVAGSRRYVGASVLACTSAYRAGAGLVTLASPFSVYQLASTQMLETVYLPLEENPDGQVAPRAAGVVRDALNVAGAGLIGTGLDHTEQVQEFLLQVLLPDSALPGPLIIDADGLNVLAQTHLWWERLKTPVILTPHPGEMARLIGCSIAEVEADRTAVAQAAAEKWQQVVVLKGAFTVIADPIGKSCLSPFANPALASGGTGDVLAGIIGALLAQRVPRYEAAVAGVYLHGMAGERVRGDLGDAGLLASDLLHQVPRALKELRAEK